MRNEVLFMSKEILLNKIVIVRGIFLDTTSNVIRCRKLIHTLEKDLHHATNISHAAYFIVTRGSGITIKRHHSWYAFD